MIFKTYQKVSLAKNKMANHKIDMLQIKTIITTSQQRRKQTKYKQSFRTFPQHSTQVHWVISCVSIDF